MALHSLDEFNFHHTLAEQERALVMVSGEGCSSCRHWKLLLSQYHEAHPQLALFEVDAGHSQALVNEFEVFHLPSLFLFKDGEFHRRLECEARLPLLEAAIDEAFALPAEEAP